MTAGVPALLGMGSTPGITNVMAGELARGLDSVDAIHVRVGCLDRSASGPLPVPYALDTVLDEFSLEPMVFRGGPAEAVPPMSGRETIDFPPPVGRAEALYTLHSEVAMFPRSFPGLREASFKVAFEPEFTKKVAFLVELGFASPREGRRRLAAGGAPRPRRRAAGSAGRPAGLRRAARRSRGTPRAARPCAVGPRWSCSLTRSGRSRPARSTRACRSRSPASFWRAETIRTPGVLCPETAVPTELFFEMLERRHMRVHWS